MIVEISVPSIPYDVVITCDKPGIIAATPNVPITVVVDVIRDGQPGETPVKGVDYFDGVNGITPVKGVDYFDGELNLTEIIVDFGSISEASNNIVVTIANTSILSTSKVICMVSGSETTDHSTDEIMLMQLNAFASKFVSGVSFNIQVFSPYKVFGKIKVNYLITN